ncbi:MAG: histone deacetylase family protein, partial [Pseudomonadota bacterium]
CREAPMAEPEAISRVHDAALIGRIESLAPTEGRAQVDPDTAMNPFSLEAAQRAAGAVLSATDAVMAGDLGNAFCSVRPPGHHAERDQSMGFCLFSNVAVAALYAVETYGLERVAIVDFDVHHGNGTEDCVQHDERILFCSSFQHPYYPGGYLPNVPGRRVNVPLPAGTGSQAFREAIEQHWWPALRDFRPQLLFISAGFDAHREDPLASLNLEDEDYLWVTRELCALAGEFAEGRIVSALEGGYALSALGRSARMHVEALLEATGASLRA